MNADAFTEASQAGSAFTRVMGTPLCYDFLSTPTQAVRNTIDRVIFVGRLAEEKGVQPLLNTARQLPDINFVWPGDGPLRKHVEKASASQSNVHYLGWLERSQVLAEIDKAQVLILPSIFETFGTVALEALARKRFVLATRDCGITKWPSLSSGIFYIEQGESLTEALTKLRQIPTSERHRQAQRSWNSVRLFNDHTIRIC